MNKYLFTWYDSLLKANLFCQWFSSHYVIYEVTIKKDLKCDCYWIYIYMRKEEVSIYKVITIFQEMIKDNPTLANH